MKRSAVPLRASEMKSEPIRGKQRQENFGRANYSLEEKIRAKPKARDRYKAEPTSVWRASPLSRRHLPGSRRGSICLRIHHIMTTPQVLRITSFANQGCLVSDAQQLSQPSHQHSLSSTGEVNDKKVSLHEGEPQRTGIAP